jgi:hypothetical protein
MFETGRFTAYFPAAEAASPLPLNAILAENPASLVGRGVDVSESLVVVRKGTFHFGENSPASFSNCGSFAMNFAGLASNAFGQFGQQK